MIMTIKLSTELTMEAAREIAEMTTTSTENNKR